MLKLTKILFLFISVTVFAQGPWTQKKGKFYTQVSYTSIANYDEFFGDPDYTIKGELSDNTLQFYTEYGLTNNTTLIVNVPLKLISAKDLKYLDPAIDCIGDCSETINETKTALGNIELGIKHNFYKKDWLLSTQLSIETNTSRYFETSGIKTGYNAFTFTPLFLAGKSFGKSYLQSFIGAKIRTNKYSNNFKIGGEYGHKIFKNLWLIGFLDIEKSLKDGNINLPDKNLLTSLYINNQEYGVMGVKAIGEFTQNFGVTASLPAAFFGNNVAKQIAFTIGIYHKF